MNTETCQAEVAKASQLTKFVLSLIRAHYEPDSKEKKDQFLETSREVAAYFDQIGESLLSSYVKVLIRDDKNVFVPM